jgi:hypothetical protein
VGRFSSAIVWAAKKADKFWKALFATVTGSEVAAVLVMMVLVALTTGLLAFFVDNPASANGKAPTNPCTSMIAAAPAGTTTAAVHVSDYSGTNGALAVYTTRANDTIRRMTTLTVQSGSLPAGKCFATAVSDLVRSDGTVIPAGQITSWAKSDSTGTRVTVDLEVSPRYLSVSGAGGYTGTVYLDDFRTVGGNVPVDVHIEYPYLWRAAMLCFAAAWVGFFWAWLINLTIANMQTSDKFWLYIVLQLAVLIVVSFPVLNAQVLTNPDWTGDLSQYIALATLAGGAALAATPTLRALIDKVSIQPPPSGNGGNGGGSGGNGGGGNGGNGNDGNDGNGSTVTKPVAGGPDTRTDTPPDAGDSGTATETGSDSAETSEPANEKT